MLNWRLAEHLHVGVVDGLPSIHWSGRCLTRVGVVGQYSWLAVCLQSYTDDNGEGGSRGGVTSIHIKGMLH